MPTAAYIGPAARLLPLEWTTSLEVEHGGRYVVQEAASRTWAFVSSPTHRPPPRTWDVELIANNATAATIQGMAEGAFGNAPVCWIPESAYLTNVLTPRQAGLADSSGGGVEVVDGWSPRSALGPSGINMALGVPILPGQPVTLSVDASGSATLRATFRNASGGSVMTAETSSTGTTMQRLHVTRTPPATARTVDLRVSGHVVAARPQVIWRNRPVPWAPGAGAVSVVVDSYSAKDRHLDPSGELFVTASVTIKEVG